MTELNHDDNDELTYAEKTPGYAECWVALAALDTNLWVEGTDE
jgi:hypothetical protein